MVVKKRNGSVRSTVTSAESATCKIKYSDTKILIVIESIFGSELTKQMKRDTKFPIDLSFRVTLGDEVLGTSQVYSIPDKEQHEIDYQIVYTLPVEPSQVLISQQLTIAVMGSGNAKDKGKRNPSRTNTRTSSKQSESKGNQASATGNSLAETIVDLLPLVFGERELEQHVDFLEVLVRLDGDLLKPPSNLLYITVQSLYNPPSTLISSDPTSATIVIRTLQPPEDPGAVEDDWSKIKFGTGLILSSDEVREQSSRRWFSIHAGSPVLSQYRNIPDEVRTRDPQKLEVDDEIDRSSVYVTWNQINRVSLEKDQEEKLISNLVESGEWLLEIYGKKPVEKRHGKAAAAEPSKQADDPLGAIPLYQVKLDVSDLLHPGVNCTRIVAPLKELQKSNLDSLPVSKTSFYSIYSQVSKKQAKADNDCTQDEEAASRRDDSENVMDALYRTSYITVLVELYTSFRPRRTTEEILSSVSEFVRARTDDCRITNDEISSPFQAQIRYKTAVLDNIQYLNGLYEEFNSKKEKVDLDATPDNELSGDMDKNKKDELPATDKMFKKELIESGAMNVVYQSMQEAVSCLVRDTCTTYDLKSGLSEMYCKIVEETQGLLREANKVEPNGPQIRASSDELFQAAREASEEGKYEIAEQFLLKRLYYYGKKDPDKWRDLAVLSLRHGDASKAKQVLMVTLCLQPRHRDGLLMLAVVFANEGNYNDATLFFEALTTFYPRFYRGWFAYFCFFETIENRQGADVCLSLGSVCMNDKERDEGELGPCSWSLDINVSEADGYILTAIYLLSLNLFQFAEICLSQHRLEVGEETLAYLYYLSVAHHIQGKFKESNSHLKEAISISWNDERLWNLMGHNLYRKQDWDRAVDCYQLILDNPELLPQNSLTFYRMGRITMCRGDYEQATKYFLKAVSISSSLQSWLGLAKASYLMGNLEDAELTAREANRLDDKASEPWAYLALINYRNCTQPDLARQCLTIATQCGQLDEELMNEIRKVLDSYEETMPEFPSRVSKNDSSQCKNMEEIVKK